MTLVALPTSPAAEIEEPDWKRLIPNGRAPDTKLHGMVVKGKVLSNAVWREYAKKQWAKVCQSLRETNTLANVNAHMIQRLVISYVRYEKAAAMVMASSAMTSAPKTGTPMLSLWQVEMRQADNDASVAEVELCLTPRRRGSAGKTARKAQGGGAPANKYLAEKN